MPYIIKIRVNRSFSSLAPRSRPVPTVQLNVAKTAATSVVHATVNLTEVNTTANMANTRRYTGWKWLPKPPDWEAGFSADPNLPVQLLHMKLRLSKASTRNATRHNRSKILRQAQNISGGVVSATPPDERRCPPQERPTPVA